MVKLTALLAGLVSGQRAGIVGEPVANNGFANAFAWSSVLAQQPEQTKKPEPVQPVVVPQTPKWKPTGRHYKGPAKKIQGTGGNGGTLAKWLPWGAWNACTGLCGNGVQTRVRRCLNGVAGIDCRGDSIGSKKCTDFGIDTCSYWSGWGAWSAPSASCNPARRCKTRTCYGRNTDHCEGPTECCEDVIYPEEPCTQETHILPGVQCCDWREPNCGKKMIYQKCGPCYENQVTLISSEAYIFPEFCPTDDIWSNWEEAVRRCEKGHARRERRVKKRVRQVVQDGVPTAVWEEIGEEIRETPLPTEYGDWNDVANTCRSVTLLTGALHTCSGTITKKRDVQCYSDEDTVDQFGQPIVRTQVIACGSDVVEEKVTIWDASNTTPVQYDQLTPEQLQTVCADTCFNAGLRLITLIIDPCEMPVRITVKAENVCGVVKPPSEWSLESRVDCAYPTCVEGTYEKLIYSRVDPCTGKVDKETRNGNACALTQCTDWSIWSACDTSFPAACEARFQERTRDCACPDQQLRQLTQCPAVAEPEPEVTFGVCLNPATGKDCGNNCMQEKVTTSVCRGESRVMVPCQCSPNPLVNQVAECKCPREGEWPLGRELRWKINSNPECDASERHDEMEYWCNTFPQEWLAFTEWTEPNDICYNKCKQYRYRCQTCDGTSSPVCALKYGSDAQESRECGTTNFRTTESECNSRCGRPGQKTITTEDLCLGTSTQQVVACTIPYSAPVREWTYGAKVFRFDTKACGGSMTRTKEAVFDQGVMCLDREVETIELPEDPTQQTTITEWSECNRNTDGFCFRTRQVLNKCGAPAETEQAPCTLGLSDWMVGTCSDYCDGIQVSKRQPICRNDNAASYTAGELEKREMCGIVYIEPRLPQLDEGSIWTYASAHFEPLSTVMWTACGMGVEAADGEWAAGVQFATRKSKCPKSVTPRGWDDVTIQRPCNRCATVTTWSAWSTCSEVCSVGSKTRYRQCLDKDGNVLQDKHGVHQTTACNANPVLKRSVTPCAAANTCTNGFGSEATQCGMGTRNVIITAEHPNADQCAEALAALGSITPEECDTGIACPYWSAWSEPNMQQCHQEPTCATQLQRTRTCQGSSYKCDCIGEPTEAVLCGPNPMLPFGAPFDDKNIACRESCPGDIYTQTQRVTCSNPITTAKECPPSVDLPSLSGWGAWDRECGPCDQGFRTRMWASRCNGLNPPFKVEQEQCVPVKNTPAWSEWDVSRCTECGGEKVRRRVYQCPLLWPTEEQYTLCPITAQPEIRPFNVCSKVCWKDESLMQTFAIAGAAVTTDQCGSTASAYSYSSIAAYDNLDPVRDIGAWNDDGIDMTTRPGYYAGYRGGWQMAEVYDRCAQKVIGRRYRQCGNCKCPHRLSHSVTAVECSASTMECPYTATAMATATCDTSVVSQPECAHIKTHPFFLQQCAGDNQVAVSCRAESRSSAWSTYSACQSADGRYCAAYEGETGTQTRSRYAGCGTSCSPQVESQQCVLPFAAPKVTYTAWREIQCAAGTGLGRMQRTRTTTNTCTGESVDAIEEQGEDVSLIVNRYSRTLSRACPTNAKCGTADGNIAYQEYTVFDRCLVQSATERGEACRITVCPYFSAWQPWEACSKSCGEGIRRRVRYCVGGELGEGYCRDNNGDNAGLTQVTSCNRGDCCNWEWSGWTGCCFNSVVNRHVRYRFQRNCGADEMVGKQGDCFATAAQSQAAVQAQSVAIGANGVATASASVSTAMTSCMSIGSDMATWRAFHNPDTKMFDGSEFHMDARTVIDVTTADVVFARVSRAYAGAMATASAATSATSYANTDYNFNANYNTGIFGGSNWYFPGISTTSGASASSVASAGSVASVGSVASAGAQAVVNQPVVNSPIVNTPVLSEPINNMSSNTASASASATAGASGMATSGMGSHATAAATSTTNKNTNNGWGSSNNPWFNFFGNTNPIFG